MRRECKYISFSISISHSFVNGSPPLLQGGILKMPEGTPPCQRAGDWIRRWSTKKGNHFHIFWRKSSNLSYGAQTYDLRWYIRSMVSTTPFIPRREVRTHSPDGVHLTVFPIYMPLVNENWGFKNTNVNRPFSKYRKPLLSGWVGEWVAEWWFFGSFDFPQI